MMQTLTKRQREVLDFIQHCQQTDGLTPSVRDIAAHFGFRSMTSALDHIRALRRKGALGGEPGRARSLLVKSPWQAWRRRVVDIPIYGVIPAGFARDQTQEANGCVSIDVETLGIRPTSRTFALKVKGDSMTGRHIIEGEIVVLEHGMPPKNGDVVAALIDNESTLKTFILNRGRPCLRAENPRYPDLLPADELVIQGVMVTLIRQRDRG
jgi:repressor LexA